MCAGRLDKCGGRPCGRHERRADDHDQRHLAGGGASRAAGLACTSTQPPAAEFRLTLELSLTALRRVCAQLEAGITAATNECIAGRFCDRLARSTFDLFAIVKRIADAGAQFRSLAEPWADTGTSTGRLMLAVLARGFGRRGARPYPHTHRRGPQPGATARAAHGPTAEAHRRAEGRGPPATGGGRDPC